MQNRKPANTTSAKKQFTQGALRVHRANFQARPMRGGIRL